MLVPSGFHAKYPIPRNAKSLRNPPQKSPTRFHEDPFFKADIVSIKETLESAPTPGMPCLAMAARISSRVKSGCLAIRAKIQSECSSNGEIAAPFRRRAPCLTPALAPSNYRTNAHLKDLGYLPPRRSAFNRFNRTLTQVRGIRPRHRFSSQANQFPQICLGDSGWESLRFNADGKCSRIRPHLGTQAVKREADEEWGRERWR